MHINDTTDYYKSSTPNLLYEITICQCLSSEELPYFNLLSENKTFGILLAEYLKTFITSPEIIVEIGGGHGTLMRDFLKIFSPAKVYMVDISETFLKKQKETLKEYSNIEFINSDIFDFINNFKEQIDLLICNEVIGDLKTIVNIDKFFFKQKYEFDTSYLPEIFNFNIGAVELVSLLKNKIRLGFISEHSSTYELPEAYKPYLLDERTNFSPRKISLYGHNEYTINFKMLKEAAESVGFKTIKKHFLQFLPLKFDKAVKFVLSSKSHQTDFHEIIYEFYNHVKEYELLILS